MTYKPVGNSYFSGAGGLDLGLQLSGCLIQQSLEFDKNCIDTLHKNFHHKIIQNDIRNITVLDQDDCDFIAVTFPCTKYSSIADLYGTRTGDELFLHAFRHIALKRPEAFVVENVPGMKKFKVVMECFTKLPDYYVNVFCPLDALNWLPQKRQRLILIGTRKPFSISAPEFKSRIKLKDILERNAKIEIPDYVATRLQGKYRDLPIISDPKKDDVAPTCVAHYSKDLSTRLIVDGKKIRPYTVREYARLQGFPDSFQFSGGDRSAYKQIGNAVAIPVGNWIGDQLIKYFN